MSVAGVCEAAVDERALRLALLDELRDIAPHDGFVWLSTDPETEVGTAPIAEVPGFGREDLPSLIRARYCAREHRWTASAPVATHRPGSGDADGSPDEWMSLLRRREVHEVATLVFRDRFGCWSFLDLWRIGGRFTPGELAALRAQIPLVTRHLRRCVALSIAPRPPRAKVDPSVVLLSTALELQSHTPGADGDLRRLLPTADAEDPVPAVAYNVAAQLVAVEAGIDAHPPVARVHAGAGEWLTVRAARLDERVAVTLEQATPSERLGVLGRASALTPREFEIVELVMAGADTRAAAARLDVSVHTVQDHLKAVFAKTGVGSRRELLARINAG